MKIIKKGLIYKPSKKEDWSLSHAQLPVADVFEDFIRIYFSTRDKNSVSRASYIEVDKSDPKKILKINKEPLLEIGEIGTFDDCGTMPSCIVDYGAKKYMYYIGWTVRNTIPYHNSIGLAVSEDGGRKFRKCFDGPIVGSSYKEPYFCGTSHVMVEDGIWRMWYLSCTGWKKIDDRVEPLYHIKYAQSKDGIIWQRDSEVAIDYKNDDEGGIVAVSVIKEEGVYKMWYSYRKAFDYRQNPDNSYKIGYAESFDGLDWKRMDEKVKMDNVGTTGEWDEVMQCYPNVVKVGDEKIMFYNGNGFGQSGIGYAIIK